MNPKPAKGAYKRQRTRTKKAAAWSKAYGSEGYVRAVTAHPCVIAARNGRASVQEQCRYLAGRSEAAHVVKKTHDDPLATWHGLVPLCTQHHAEGEGKAPSYYREQYGVDIVNEAALMVAAYAHLVPVA